MNSSLQQIDFASLTTIQLPEIKKITILRETETHVVCRLTCNHASYILKWFKSPVCSVELQAYSLLKKAGVETLPLYECTDRALLLEDIQFSSRWRLATDSDMGSTETGRAVAEWYKNLHRAGREMLRKSNGQPLWLCPWVSKITGSSLEKAGVMLELQNEPVWKVAIGCIETLKAKYLALPQTFNYNDFAAENLALSCGQAHLRAIVFDYDCFATGVVYSDWRNVVYSLYGAAKESFMEAYGPVTEQEHLLDEPLAILEGLVVASQRSKIPNWASPLIEAVVDGGLEHSISQACEI